MGITDVATAAGVSISTVSVALNDPGARISPQTRERVREVAQRLGYAPNRLAAGLRSQRSGIVGFIGDTVATTPYAVGMILGAQQVLRAAGRLMVLMSTEEDPDLERSEIATLLQQPVDGILYATMYHRKLEPPPLLRTVPTVLLDAESRDPAVSWVVPDEVAGARAAVRELLDHGHRRLGFVTMDEDIPATRLRLRGYRAELKRAGLPAAESLIRSGPGSADGGYQTARHLLDRPDRPTGLFCFRDIMAMGAYRAAAELGLRVPEDLSIVGYDDMQHVAEGLFPGLTTVQLPHYDMGAWAARQLLALTGTPAGPVEQVRLAGRLVRRGSVAAAPAGPAG